MRNRTLQLALTSMMMSFCVTISAQQPQSFADSIPSGFNSILIDENATAEEIIRRNPDFMRFNENGVLMVRGKEVNKMIVNGKVVYSQDDTITDPVRLLKEIARRVNENNTPVQGVVAHIDDSKQFSDSLPPQYRLPEGQTIEDVIRKLPGVEILEDGTITVNGKKVTRLLYDGTNHGIQDTTVTQVVM